MFLSFIGGVLFKVYIVGDAIRVVRRFSLPNVDEGDLSNNAGVFRFPRVSCAAATAEDADLDPHVAGKLPWLGFSCLTVIVGMLPFYIDFRKYICQLMFLHIASELPPRPLLEILARELRRRLVPEILALVSFASFDAI